MFCQSWLQHQHVVVQVERLLVRSDRLRHELPEEVKVQPFPLLE